MSDKLEWMNKHFVLLRHILLKDVIEKEAYKIPPNVAEMFKGKTNATDVVWDFADVERYKCASELLAYTAHRRAGVWWVYNCLLSLNEELKENPPEEIDINSIGASFEPVVPDFAKVELPKDDPEMVAQGMKAIADMQETYAKARAAADPEILKFLEDGLEVAFKEFESVHGIHPMALLDKATEKLSDKPYQMDENSPIFKVAEELKQKIQTVRTETLDTINAVIPPSVPAHNEKMKDDALHAIYRWIVSPDEVNSKMAMDVGNACPDTPAGLLALCAFWAGGNLLPEGEQVVATPPGLLANGLCQVLLMCALHKGGTRKLKERYEHYFEIGVDVMTGQKSWDESVILGEKPKVPEVSEQESVAIEEEKEENVNQEEKLEAIEEIPEKKKYQRWKPQEPCVDLTKKKGFKK